MQLAEKLRQRQFPANPEEVREARQIIKDSLKSEMDDTDDAADRETLSQKIVRSHSLIYLFSRRREPYIAATKQTNTKANNSRNTSTRIAIISLRVHCTTGKITWSSTGSNIKTHSKVTAK